MAEEYKDRGLEVLAVNVAGDSRAKIKSFAIRGNLQQRFVSNGRRLARHYDITGTPTSIYLDTEGRVTARQVGTRSIGEMRKKIEAILP